MLKQYNNYFIKSLFENGCVINKFNLSDEFYKQFISRNREMGFALYMLRDLRTFVNTVINFLKIHEKSIVGAYLIGYNNYNTIFLTIFTKEKLNLKFEQNYLFGTIVKKIEIEENYISLSFNIFSILKIKKFPFDL